MRKWGWSGWYFIIWRFFVKPWFSLYYKRFKVNGMHKVPTDRPVLFVGNHQNAFMDAFCLLVKAKKQIYFLTRADVFKEGLAEKVLSACHMIPIYRKRDGKDFDKRTQETFDLVKKMLSERDQVLIFAEGNCDPAHRLRPLQTGFARLAFDALTDETNPSKDLLLIPFGVNYSNHTEFRQSAVVNIGDPIEMGELLDDYNNDGRKAVVELKKTVTAKLKELILDAPSTVRDEVINCTFSEANRQNLDFAKDFKQIKEIESKVNDAFKQDDSTLAKAYKKLATFLETKGLSKNHFFRYSFRNTPKRWISFLFQLPAIPALLSLFAPLLMAEKVAAKMKQDQFKTSIRFVVGMFSAPIAGFILVLLIGLFTTWSIAGVALAAILISIPFAMAIFDQAYISKYQNELAPLNAEERKELSELSQSFEKELKSMTTT